MSKDQKTIVDTGNYWNYLVHALETAIDADRESVGDFIKKYRGLFDFGIAPQQLKDVRGSLPSIPADQPLKCFFVGDWLTEKIETLIRIREQVRITEEIAYLCGVVAEIDARIRKKQEDRFRVLKEMFDFESEVGMQYKGLIITLPRVDDIRYVAIYKNDQAGTGTYFDVDNRRTFASERLWVMKQDRRVEEMLKALADRSERLEARKSFDVVEGLLKDKLRIERAIERLGKKLEDLKLEIGSIPSGEIVDSLRIDIERVRDLMVKEQKVSGGETGVFRSANEPILDISEIYSQMRHIQEYDRRTFINRLSRQLGRPRLLFVPGKGAGIYDYRENLFIIPLIPVYSVVHSLSSAVASYLFHADEKGAILRSYGMLFPALGNPSGLPVRQHFINSYVKWITTEYKGFLVLEKEERQWFLKQCAPAKQDFYIPLELMEGVFSFEENQQFIKNVRVAVNSGEETTHDLWFISILECMRERYKKGIMYINRLIDRSGEDYPFAYYNKAMAHLRLGETNDAVEAFSAFVEFDSKSWWGRTAQGHLQNLTGVKSNE